jgi:pyruvate-ferredoxin/flavodoxin oxidoreductase
MLAHSNPEAAERLLELAEEDVKTRWHLYEQLAAMSVNGAKKEEHND